MSNSDANLYLDHVYGKQTGYLNLFSGTRPEGEEGKVNKGRLRDVDDRYFEYPGQGPEAVRYASEASSAGRNVYVCAHLLEQPARRKANASLVGCLWVDADCGMPSGNVPKPTLTVESSPGKYHLYWRLLRPVESHEAEALNKRLAYALGTDRSGWDLTQLLRLPGSTNYDYADVGNGAPTVGIVEASEESYCPEKLGSLLPALPATREPVPYESRIGKASDTLPPQHVTRYLGRRGRRIFEGGRPVLKPDEEVDRSASLYKIACELCEALRPHFRKEEILGVVAEALVERDESLGWERYTNRPSEYRRIVSKKLSKDEDM